MQTQYKVNRDPAVEGMPYGLHRDSAPYTLPVLAQVTDVVIADGSPAAGEDWTLTFTDDEAQIDYSVDFQSGASLAASLDNAVAAAEADADVSSRFTFSENGVDTLTVTARNSGRAYTVSLSVEAGSSATSTATITQASGGSPLPLGRMVARGSAQDTMRALAAGDTAPDVAGFLFRTDGNHFQEFDEPSTAVAEIKRGRTMSVIEEGRFWVKTPDAVTDLTSSVYVRLTSADAGVFTPTADGGNTLDVSAFCRWDSTAAADGLARVRMHKQG